MRNGHRTVRDSPPTPSTPAVVTRFPAWLLRGALVVSAAVAVITTMISAPQLGPGTFIGVVLIALAIGVGLAPGSVLPLLLLVILVLSRLAITDASIDVELFILVAALPMIHQLAAVSAAIPAHSQVSWQVVRPSLIRVLAAIAVVMAALVVALLVN